VEDVEGAQHVVPRDAARACRLEADGDEPRWRCNGCNARWWSQNRRSK
jgi:hypothetical protein